LGTSILEATVSAHIGHLDFRVRGKIFAMLGYHDKDSGVVKLTPDEQREFVRSDPNVFQPVKGAWGCRGATSVSLPTAKVDKVREAFSAAWRNTAPKRPVETRQRKPMAARRRSVT